MPVPLQSTMIKQNQESEGYNNVLIIDPEMDIAIELKTYLSRLKYSVLTVKNTDEAISTIAFHNISIVIYIMQGFDNHALELIKSIRTIKDEPNILLICDFSDVDMIINARHYGVTEFIKRPFNLLEVRFALERLSYGTLNRKQNTNPNNHEKN